MIYFKENDNIISKKIIVPNDNNKLNDFIKSTDRNLIVSTLFVESALEAPVFQKKKAIDLSFKEEDLKLFDEILESNLDTDTKFKVISELYSLKDIYNLYLILQNIKFSTIDEFYISELQTINVMCEQIHIESEASKILNVIPMAEKNTKVLELTKKM